MLYKLSVKARKNPLVRRVVRKANKIVGKRADIGNEELVQKYAKGKSFADIGCMWGVNGLFSFIAEETGATSVTAVDVYEESPEFLEEKKRRDSKIRFVRGDINSQSTADEIGQAEVVLCSGVLYHTPDPIHMLTRLRAICKEILILNTCSIPEVPGLKNAAVFYPYLDAEQRAVWNQGLGLQMAISGPYEPENGYGNWFWGMTPSSIESMLKVAGFEVTESFVFPFKCVFVCNAVETKFVASSGEWITPQDEAFLKHKR
jgi:hypothetical protein